MQRCMDENGHSNRANFRLQRRSSQNYHCDGFVCLKLKEKKMQEKLQK